MSIKHTTITWTPANEAGVLRERPMTHRSLISLITVLAVMMSLLTGCGQPAPAVSVDELPYSDEVVYDEPFALINENNAFLSAAGDNDTLIL